MASQSKQKGSERRREPRVELRTAVSYRNFDSPGKIKNAICQDISGKGINLLSASSLREKEAIDLWVLNPETDQLINIEGNVAWVAVDDLYGDSPYWVRAGVCFTAASQAQLEQWHKLLKKRGIDPAATTTIVTTETEKDDERISFLI